MPRLQPSAIARDRGVLELPRSSAESVLALAPRRARTSRRIARFTPPATRTRQYQGLEASSPRTDTGIAQ